MLDVLPWINIVGLIAAWVQAYRRVGFGDVKWQHGVDWREFLFSNLPWFGLTVVKVILWWVTFIVWLVRGRPGPTWRAIVEKGGREVRIIEKVSP